MTDQNTEKNGFPTFTATLAGINDVNAYYMLDLTSDYSIFWNTACIRTGSIGPGSCNLSPTLMNTGFSASNNATGLIHKTGVFTNAQFGGYVASGTKYTSRFCLDQGICKIITAYSAESVSQDNWLYDSDATNGIIGLGPNSAFWNGYTDPETLISSMSISLARIKAGGLIPPSNITFGALDVLDPDGLSNYANLTALANYSY
jgi:hypothetical protein